MRLSQPELALRAVAAVALRHFTDDELCAFNNAIQTFGRIPRENLSHDHALEAGLIDAEGKPCDLESLKDASALVVNHRFSTA